MEGDLQAILDVLNAWADADLDRLRANHAEMTALLLPRLPPVIPDALPPLEPGEARTPMAVLKEMRVAQGKKRRRYGEGPRAKRQLSDPHPEGWGHERER